MIVVHPLQQRARLVRLLLWDRGWRLFGSAIRLVHLSAHRLPVLDRRGRIAEHALEVGAKPLERVQVGDAVDLDGSASPASRPRRRPRPVVDLLVGERMIGRATRCIALPCRVTSIVTESTRNGMSAITVSMTVYGDSQPCSSTFGL